MALTTHIIESRMKSKNERECLLIQQQSKVERTTAPDRTLLYVTRMRYRYTILPNELILCSC
jgi:hypothetical protein